jgi:small subunit ribosomal protein S4
MIIGPKYKICKRLGSNVFEKCQTKQFSVAAQRVSDKGGKKRAGSDYNRQLLEKQKLRLIYSLTERQFSSYVHAALGSGENPSQHLFATLESRLDSVAYRMGLVTTRRAARQLAAHGHMTVNGVRVTIPSYRVNPGDVVAIRPGSQDSGLFAGLTDRLKEYRPPAWVTIDADKKEGTLVSAPAWGSQDSVVDFGAVFEYYTR